MAIDVLKSAFVLCEQLTFPVILCISVLWPHCARKFPLVSALNDLPAVLLQTALERGEGGFHKIFFLCVRVHFHKSV